MANLQSLTETCTYKYMCAYTTNMDKYNRSNIENGEK